MSLIFSKIITSYKQNLPFVCFKKPNTSQLRAYFENDSSLRYSDSFEDSGFVFSPFDDKTPTIIFLNDTCEVLDEKYESNPLRFSKKNNKKVLSDKESHLELVRKAINAIQNKEFVKVVLSRKETIQTKGIDLLDVFERLLQKYHNAFVYIWFHPKVGLWMGATPEKLMTLKKGEFHTVALAGTKNYNGFLDPVWGAKENKEHQYVIDYIVSRIKDQKNGLILKEFTISDTYTTRAGNLLHLKADIKGFIGDFNLKAFIYTLHPTPAVCGLPKESAKSFIIENENYKRTYYTGFLGEINIDSKTELFVNLRCVEIDGDNAFIYVGGGITNDSDPEKEWVETIYKTRTIKSVL